MLPCFFFSAAFVSLCGQCAGLHGPVSLRLYMCVNLHSLANLSQLPLGIKGFYGDSKTVSWYW